MTTTITRRITLVSAVVMALVLLGGGAGVYFGERFSLDRSLRRELSRQADEVRTLVEHPGAVSSQDLQDRRDSYVQVLDEGGRELAATPPLRGKRLLRSDQVRQARVGTHTFQRGSLSSRGGSSFRIRTQAVAEGGARRIIVVAARRDSRDEALRELIGQLLGFGAIAMVLIVLIEYRVARAALRPVEALRGQADALYRGRSAGSLEVPGSHDEIAALATTLNDLLGRVQQTVGREQAFSAAVSHELRTPLTALKAELDLALRAPRSNDELLAAIRDASSDADRLVRLADDLLLLRTPEVGVPSGVHRVGGIVDRAVGDRDVNVQVAPDAAEALVAGSADLLARALQNLLDNAERYGAHPIRLEVAVVDDVVALEVSDAGPGLPEELRSGGIAAFRRGPGQASGTGSGLGLSIVEAIVRAHRGTMDLGTEPASLVRLRIPVSPGASPAT